MLYGVDVHGQYQAGLNFKKLKAEGYSFVVVKATEGISFQAPQFTQWVAATRAEGMIPGAYHWIKRGNGAEQADFFYDRCKAAGGVNGLLIQLDCEDNATWEDLVAWTTRWNTLTNKHPFMIYTGAWWWANAARNWAGNTLTPYLWDSHYISGTDANTISDDPAALATQIPASWWQVNYGGWKTPTILQFTSKGDAGGLGNNVDLNATHLSLTQLLALTTPGGIVATVDANVVGIDDQRIYATNERVGSLVAMKDTTVVRWTSKFDPLNPNAITEPNNLVLAVKHIDTVVDATNAAVLASAAKLDALIKIITDALSTDGNLDTAAILTSIDHVSQQIASLTAENAELKQKLADAFAAE